MYELYLGDNLDIPLGNVDGLIFFINNHNLCTLHELEFCSSDMFG
mgnify:CR=1 FL=1